MSLEPEAQSIIDEELKTLERVIGSLREQEAHDQARLATESERARTLTSSIVNTRRVEDKAMLASDEAVAHALKDKKQVDIKTLNKLIDKPYFGRIVLEEERAGTLKQIEYKIGYSANPDCRIIDWKTAPISKLFYEYKEGDEYSEQIQGQERNGRVKLRHTVEIVKGELRGVSCRLGNFVRKNGEWLRSDGSARSRAAGSDGHLPSILPLITADQFRMITEDASTAILIQGIAGSGKTTVALHRLAWLLDAAQNTDLRIDNCAVIVLSRALKAYIAKTLPELGVSGVPVFTLDEWSAKQLAAFVPHLLTADGGVPRPETPAPHGCDRVKRSMAFLKAVEEYCSESAERISAKIRASLPWDTIPAGIKKVFDDAVAAKTAPIKLLKELTDLAEKAISSLEPSNPRAGGLYFAKTALDELLKDHAHVENELLEVLSHPERILALKGKELIDRELIDAAYERTKQCLENGTLDVSDDAAIVRICELRFGTLKISNLPRGKYQHIVVDEVQDLSPVSLAGIIAAVERPDQLTLVGDAAQQLGREHTFPGWDVLREQWQFKEAMSRFITLTVSHRSTLPIMHLADYIQQRKVVTEGRDGRVPLWFKARKEEHGVTAALKWLTKAIELYPSAMTAVICTEPQEAKHVLTLLRPTFGAAVRIGDQSSFSFEEGIVVTDLQQVKGLEFGNVLIWNPTRKHIANTTQGRNLLYVAVTRAEENLCVTTWGKSPEILPPPHARLMRVVELGFDEEEQEQQPRGERSFE